jgi:hypothetical protein
MLHGTPSLVGPSSLLNPLNDPDRNQLGAGFSLCVHAWSARFDLTYAALKIRPVRSGTAYLAIPEEGVRVGFDHCSRVVTVAWCERHLVIVVRWSE